MAHDDLPVNVDASYTDDGAHPDVKLHQQHHDELHYFHNLFDILNVGAWPDGGLPFWEDTAQKFSVIDPAISGSPGPPGEDGISVVFMGSWASDVAYNPGEVVRSSGSVYGCILANTNADPSSNPTYWAFLVADGVDGATGAQGTTGATGATGPAGPTVSVRQVFTDLGAAATFDAGDYDYAVGTLTEDCDIDFEDSTGAEVSAMTLRLYQGAGAPHAVTWSGVNWVTTDGLPPDLTGMGVGDFVVLAFDQVDGIWCGYAPGGGAGAEPLPEIFPTLAFDNLYANGVSTDQSTPYISSTNLQIGNERVAHLFVNTTVTSAVDPPLSIVTGAGATSGWTAGATTVWGTGGTRRRLSHFVAQDAVSGAASPLTITQNLTDLALTPGGVAVTLTSCIAFIIRTTRSPSTAKALAVAKSVAGTTTSPTIFVTLAAASDALNRAIFGATDNGATSTFSTIVSNVDSSADANWTQLTNSPVNVTSPSIRSRYYAKTTAFDTIPAGLFSGAIQGAMIATECEQGPTS